jgi:hypothetical protein
MTSPFVTEASHAAAGNDRVGYDGVELALHWITVLLVVTLYALSQIWSFLPRETPPRMGMQWVHVSLGILLAAVVVTRIVWRLGPGRRVPAATTGLMEFASQIVHYGLYALQPFGIEEQDSEGIDFPPGLRRPILAVPAADPVRYFALSLYGPHAVGTDLDSNERAMLSRLARFAAAMYAELEAVKLRHRIATLEQKFQVPSQRVR